MQHRIRIFLADNQSGIIAQKTMALMFQDILFAGKI